MAFRPANFPKCRRGWKRWAGPGMWPRGLFGRPQSAAIEMKISNRWERPETVIVAANGSEDEIELVRLLTTDQEDQELQVASP